MKHPDSSLALCVVGADEGHDFEAGYVDVVVVLHLLDMKKHADASTSISVVAGAKPLIRSEPDRSLPRRGRRRGHE